MCEICAGMNEQRLLFGQSFDTLDKSETTHAVQSQAPLDAPLDQALVNFKSKKKERCVYWKQQDGVNCGMYAAAMAISSLLTAKKDDIDQSIGDIAKLLQEEVVGKELSALGEMYNAKELAKAINRFLTTITSGTKICRDASERYHAQARTVDSEAKFKALLSECTKRGLRVLVPYLAYGEQCKPGMFDMEMEEMEENEEAKVAKIIPLNQSGKAEVCGIGTSEEDDEIVKARAMNNAHWCMVYELYPSGNVKLVEGNNGFTHTVPCAHLFQSNESLVDKFPLKSFIEENQGWLYCLQGLPEKPIAAEKIKDEIEVNLRHQVIVIGRNSESYNHRTAVNEVGPYRVTKTTEAAAADPAAAAATDEKKEDQEKPQ